MQTGPRRRELSAIWDTRDWSALYYCTLLLPPSREYTRSPEGGGKVLSRVSASSTCRVLRVFHFVQTVVHNYAVVSGATYRDFRRSAIERRR